jgi:hypothetical protein
MIRRCTLSVLIALLLAATAFASATTVRGRVLAADGTRIPAPP